MHDLKNPGEAVNFTGRSLLGHVLELAAPRENFRARKQGRKTPQVSLHRNHSFFVELQYSMLPVLRLIQFDARKYSAATSSDVCVGRIPPHMAPIDANSIGYSIRAKATRSPHPKPVFYHHTLIIVRHPDGARVSASRNGSRRRVAKCQSSLRRQHSCMLQSRSPISPPCLHASCK